MASSTGTALSSSMGRAIPASARPWGGSTSAERSPALPKPPVGTGHGAASRRAPLDTALACDVSSRFGRRLRELRLSRGLTQADMARTFGIDRSFISEMECGRKAVSLPMIEVIALGLHISLSELLEGL